MPSLGALTGRRVVLRPMESMDAQWIYSLASSPTASNMQWRLRGNTGTPGGVMERLSVGASVQLVAAMRATPYEPLGLLQLLSADTRRGHAHLSVAFREERQVQGWPFEAVVLFIDYVFRIGPFRKLYMHSLAPVADLYRSATRGILVEEGVLREHAYFAGGFVDMHIFALYRTRWLEDYDGIQRMLGRGSSDFPQMWTLST